MSSSTDIGAKSMQDVDVIRKSGDLAGEGKVFGYKGKQLTTTGRGGGISFAKSWDMRAKHGFSLEQIAAFRNQPIEEVIRAAAEWVDLSQDYFRQVNIVSAALSPDQVSRDWAQWLVNNTPDGEKLLTEGLEQVVENNNKVLSQFENLPDKLLAPQRSILSRANIISNRVNQYAEKGPIKYINPMLKGTDQYPKGLQNVDEVMDIYRLRATGKLKPGQVTQKLREQLANRGLDPDQIDRALSAPLEAKQEAYDASKQLLSGADIGEEYVGKKAGKVLKYTSKAGKLFKSIKPWLLAVPVVAPVVSGIGTSVQAAETIRNPTAENKARLLLNVAETGGEFVSTAGWLTANPALIAGGEAVATPTGLADLGWTAKDLELHKAKTWRQLGVGAKDWFMEKVTDDKGISKLWYEEEEEKPVGAI
jgi:hypothetical protein